MLGKSVIKQVRRYLRHVQEAGIPVERAIVFGSYARGEQRRGSDIDLLVVSPAFNGRGKSRLVDVLWQQRRFVDYRIEPVAVGSRRFVTDAGSPLLEAARREGVEIPLTGGGHPARREI